MPPIAIKYHDRPPAHDSNHVLIPIPPTQWSTHLLSRSSTPTAHTSSSYITYRLGVSPSKQNNTRPAELQTTRSSSASTLSASSSTPTSTSTPPKRRKMMFKPFDPSLPHITLRPMLEPILLRCLPSYTNNDSSSHPIPPSETSTKSMHTHRSRLTNLHPYSRLTDGANTRSPNPSPKEIKRREKTEEEKARLKRENAALARIRKRGKKSRSRISEGIKSSNGNGNINGNVNEDVNGNVNVNVNPKSQSPSIQSIPTHKATPPFSQDLETVIPKTGMKRTRSGGLSVVTMGLNHANGGNLGSPLRAVTGPKFEDDDRSTRKGDGDDDEDERGREKKKSRLGLNSTTDDSRTDTRRKAVSHSPPSHTVASSQLEASVPETQNLKPRRGSHNLSSSSGIRSGSGMGSGIGATDMRRVVSVGSSNVGESLAGLGPSGGASANASGRVRRAMILPGRLRDYDVRSGGVV